MIQREKEIKLLPDFVSVLECISFIGIPVYMYFRDSILRKMNLFDLVVFQLACTIEILSSIPGRTSLYHHVNPVSISVNRTLPDTSIMIPGIRFNVGSGDTGYPVTCHPVWRTRIFKSSEIQQHVRCTRC